MSVALDAGIGRPPNSVRRGVGRHDLLLELFGEVEDVMVDPEPCRHATGVFDVAHRAASRVARTAPELHRGPHYVMARFGQQRGRDRRVHPTRKPDQHPHAQFSQSNGDMSAAGRLQLLSRAGAALPLGTKRVPRRCPTPSSCDRERASRGVSPPRPCRPIANRTWLGSTAPLAHADPAEAQTPSSSRTMSSSSASTPSTPRLQMASMRSGRGTASCTPGTASRIPPTNRADSSRTRPDAPSRSRAVASAAAAIATMPATFSVPARRSRSCGPPRRMGRSTAPPRTTSAPIPFGPPNLWALTLTRSAPAVSRGDVEPAERLHGVGVHDGPGGALAHHRDDGLERLA